MSIEEILQGASKVLAFYLEHLSQLAIVSFDEEENVEDCNQGFLKMLGLSAKPVGRKITDLFSFDAR
ncbi:MAG: PAS domain-containing protein, partial [Candidatus Atribacteria bacterium]|nr:PAS domain-containing protein [Candidatus Atribacteria bacterium]